MTFYDADGSPIYEAAKLQVSDGAKTAQLPATVTKKAVSVSVRYYSESFQTLTGDDLGSSFMPGAIEITAVVDKQEGGPGKKEVAKIRNTAKAVLKYCSWDGSGEKAEMPVELTQEAMADVAFGEQKAAQVSVKKTALTVPLLKVLPI